MNGRQLAEWDAFFKIEPDSAVRADMRAALVAWIIANSNRNSKKYSRAFPFENFMLNFEKTDETQTADEMKAVFTGMAKGKS